ncbi:alpha/beta-hydrolase [Artomyces pyxidatus]|uniref:Alpha/beta-hydrolase n=1 Tax=Artomyces pyxidatus TaxID=48021 RepID=A0ACB8SQR0_9AGAM|nr:alpha/beta-hydrolase [Artomyces pyxidatus]
MFDIRNSPTLDIRDFLLPGESVDDGLTYSLQLYRPGSSGPLRVGSSPRVALVFLHAISTHKETWLPLIERLFDIQATAHSSAVEIVEAWTLDLINHGRAGHINEHSLLMHPETFGGHQGGRMLRTFLDSGLVTSGTSIIAIGHSGGAVVTAFSTLGYSLRSLPFTRMIIIEPAMMPRSVHAELFSEPTRMVTVMHATKSRKDIWPTRAAAREWLSKHSPWRDWHPRILNLFVDHGLRDLPTAKYPDLKTGVTLSCTRDQESFSYSQFQDCVDGLERLEELCTAIPVDCILGGVASIVSREMQQGVFDICRDKPTASVTVLEGAGHLVAQEDPDRLAATVWAAMNRQTCNPRNKL